MKFKKSLKFVACAFITIILFISFTGCLDIETPKFNNLSNFSDIDTKLKVSFIDVGQGDSILLSSDDEFVLVDAGEKEYGEAVLDYIKSQGAKSLKYVIATHPHSDHIGGLKTVINGIECENFITSETDQSTTTWLNVLRAVDKNDVNFIDSQPGATYSFGEAQFTVLAPLSDGYEGYNNYSVVIKATCSNISYLLCGDAETISEKEMLKSKEDLSADVIKLGHHGSSTSSSKAFIKAVNPSFAIISCGKNNDYGHPHKETIKTLNDFNITYYRTDELGTIVSATDGTYLKFYSSTGNISDETYIPSSKNTADTSDTKDKTQTNEESYIGNKNSKIFHNPDCSGAVNMSDKNKVYFDSRDKAIENGYAPCGSCKP